MDQTDQGMLPAARTTSDVRRSRKAYPPLPAQNVAGLVQYVAQALARREAPHSNLRPDLSLLLLIPSGPLTDVWLDQDPEHPDRLAIHFKLLNDERGARFCPPDVFPAVMLPIAYGGGLNINDNTGNWEGLSYLRYGGGNDRMMVSRALADANMDQVVKQRSPGGQTTDHHNADPQFLSTATSAQVRDEEGKPMRTPRRGRPFVIGKALELYRKNHHRSDATLTEAEYRRGLEDAYMLNDLHRLERSHGRNSSPAWT